MNDRTTRGMTILILSTPVMAMITEAQVSYSFEHTSAAYAPLEQYTSCSFDPDGSDRIDELDGELFHFFGGAYVIGDEHPMNVGDYGFVRVDDDSSLLIIDGLFTTLEIHDQESDVRYAITGESGQLVLAVEWHRWRLSNGPEGNFASWTIRVEQATGVITVHIGPNSGGGILFNTSTGPNCGIFHAPHTFSTCYEKLWVEGAPTDIALDTLPNFDFDALLGFPPAHSVFRFTPRTSVTGIGPQGQESCPHWSMATDHLMMSWPDAPALITVELFDATGRAMHRTDRVDRSCAVATSTWPRGMYLAQVRSGAAVHTRRVVLP